MESVLPSRAAQPIDRQWCVAADAADPLAPLRSRFHIPDGLVYLDGNSLGALPVGALEKVDRVVRKEWGDGLIASWMKAGWIDQALRLGDRLAPLLGAGAGQVLVCDTTTVNLQRLLTAVLERSSRRVVLTEQENFHTDLYAASGVARMLGAELRMVPRTELEAALDDSVSVLMLTHVDYRTGEMHDHRRLTEAAHAVGAMALWDLCHSVGAVPLALDDAEVDLAVGCGYKYLNGGPGAPAFLYVATRHQRQLDSPLRGWLGHRDPFAFAIEYEPADGIRRQLVSSPSILGMAALEAALDVFADVDMAELREKSLALTTTFMDLVESRCAGSGLRLATPRDPHRRGSQVALAHEQAYGVVQALIERGVVGDFRAPDIARFGFAPLYLRFLDVWEAVDRLAGVLADGAHLDPRHAVRAAVT
ncbi:MAG: kynureninase [Candidatus Dormiibacterota bacterium]